MAPAAGSREHPVSLLTCTNSGQKSPLSAKACKECGRAFGRPPERAGRSGSGGSFLASALVVAALLGGAAWWWWPSFRILPSSATTEMTAGLAPPSPAPVEPSAAAVDSPKAIQAAPKRPERDSTPKPAAPPKPARDTVQREEPKAAPAPVAIDPAHQRYAQDYVKLRSEPSSGAAVLRVLQRGEVVTVDSLQDGWYRVVLDSASVGYVDRQYLDTLPPGNH